MNNLLIYPYSFNHIFFNYFYFVILLFWACFFLRFVSMNVVDDMPLLKISLPVDVLLTCFMLFYVFPKVLCYNYVMSSQSYYLVVFIMNVISASKTWIRFSMLYITFWIGCSKVQLTPVSKSLCVASKMNLLSW